MPYLNKFCKKWNDEIKNRKVVVSEIVDELKPTDYFGIAPYSGFLFLNSKQIFERDVALLDAVYNKHGRYFRNQTKETPNYTPDEVPQSLLLREVQEVFIRHLPDEPPLYVLKVEGSESGMLLLLDEYDIFIIHCQIRHKKNKPLTIALDFDAIRSAQLKPVMDRYGGVQYKYNKRNMTLPTVEILTYYEEQNPTNQAYKLLSRGNRR